LRGAIPQRLAGTLRVVKGEIPSQFASSDLGAVVTLEIDLLILHGPPQSLGEDVI
jgi:hypothetical protein